MKQNKIYIFLPIAISLLLPGINFLSHTTDWPIWSYNSIIRWLWSSAVLYVLWYILIWTNKIQSKYKWIWIVACIVLFMTIVHILFSTFVFESPFPIHYQLFVKIFFASILILIIQFAMKANANISLLQIEKEQALTEKYKLQLQELRTRIDPHFLFNSLSSLRSMVRLKDENSEQFILQLAHLYRQILKVKDLPTVTLKEELDVLNSYKFLMQQRTATGVIFNENIDSIWEKYRLPTLSLQTVVENCFKHNIASTKLPLNISIKIENVLVVVSNNIQQKISLVEKSGYGLQNIARSYELLKVENGISYSEIDGQFIVKLKLLKDERIDH